MELLKMFENFRSNPPRANPEFEAITDHQKLPLGTSLDQILRYETTIQRQLVHAIGQLERLQRSRQGARSGSYCTPAFDRVAGS
jgi:hypothetical protein